MKRVGLLTSVALFTVALLAGTATAQEGVSADWANKAGAVGIGGNTSLGGSNGLLIRTYVTPQLGLQLTFGFGVLSQSDDSDTETSANYFDVGVYASYKLAYWQRGHLSLLFGFDIRTYSETVDVAGTNVSDDSAVDFLIGLGIMGEYFPTQYLSLFVSAGFLIDLMQEDELWDDATSPAGRDIVNAPGNSGFAMNLSSDLFGAAGFTVWFK